MDSFTLSRLIATSNNLDEDTIEELNELNESVVHNNTFILENSRF